MKLSRQASEQHQTHSHNKLDKSAGLELQAKRLDLDRIKIAQANLRFSQKLSEPIFASKRPAKVRSKVSRLLAEWCLMGRHSHRSASKPWRVWKQLTCHSER